MSEEKSRTYKVARSSVNGRFVKKIYAKRHPNTTTWETVKVEPREKPEEVVLDDTPIEEL